MKRHNSIEFLRGTDQYLHNGDCVKFLKTMPDKCVNVTLSDLPYGEVNDKVKGNTRLDVGVADDVNFDLREVIEQFIRVTTDNVVVFCGTEQISDIIRIMRSHKMGTRLLVWNKPDGRPLNAQFNICSSAEFCVVGRFSKATFHGYNIRNVLTYPTCRGKKRIHPTQKPINLMRDLVQIYSNEGDIIFDPFMGSGTSGEAALGLGRKYIGCELYEPYYVFARDRIENTVLNMPAKFCDGRYQEKKPSSKSQMVNSENRPRTKANKYGMVYQQKRTSAFRVNLQLPLFEDRIIVYYPNVVKNQLHVINIPEIHSVFPQSSDFYSYISFALPKIQNGIQEYSEDILVPSKTLGWEQFIELIRIDTS